MPDRIIRDELLTSERYWSVGIEAQQLFTHLLLRADSLGRYSGKNFTIRMSCYPGHARNPDVIEKLLSDLHDADLIRLYVDERGERFVFIPRYRQRLRYTNSKYPAPPFGISDITEEKSDSSQTQVRPAPPEVKRREVKQTPSVPPLASSRRRAAGTSIPEPFSISDRIRAWAAENHVFNLAQHFAFFVNQAKAKDYRYADWDRALMNAILKDWAKIGLGTDPNAPRKVALG